MMYCDQRGPAQILASMSRCDSRFPVLCISTMTGITHFPIFQGTKLFQEYIDHLLVFKGVSKLAEIRNLRVPTFDYSRYLIVLDGRSGLGFNVINDWLNHFW